MTKRGKRFPGVTLHQGRYYFVKRVPKGLSGLVCGEDGQPIQQMRVALRTDGLTEANIKAAKVAELISAEWAALEAGQAQDARLHYLAARRVAETRGFPYIPLEALVEHNTSTAERVRRTLAAVAEIDNPAAVTAILGTAPVALPRLSEILPEVEKLTEVEHRRKSEAQLDKWRNPRERALQEWSKVTDDLPLDQITRTQALVYRQFWSDRVTRDGLTPQYANKIIGHLSGMFSTYVKAHNLELQNPFKGLSLKGEVEKRRPSFSLAWVRDTLLRPGALDKLNAEASNVLRVMINTGARPSEITDAPLSDWRLDAKIPHLVIAAHGRELKVAHTAREIPLLGVSLEAAREIAKSGGCQRYHHKAGAWSAVVNKYLRNNGLSETTDHTAYSLRHYVEDRLLMTGADDRVRADILGHDYQRPKYGDGGALEGRRIALERIAL